MIFFQYATLRDLLNPVFMNRQPGEQILQNATVNCLPGWKEPDCQTCAQRWAGDSCDKCAWNFGPLEQCDSCLTGWVGPNCDACEGFGFSAESNCTECIQNGHWTGTFNGQQTITVYLTFDGPACTNLVPGMY